MKDYTVFITQEKTVETKRVGKGGKGNLSLRNYIMKHVRKRKKNKQKAFLTCRFQASVFSPYAFTKKTKGEHFKNEINVKELTL